MLNTNVKLTLGYTFLFALTNSLMSNNPLAAFILLIARDAPGVPRSSTNSSMAADDNLAVGVATGVQGVVNLLVALPAGVLADRIGRQRVLRAAAVVGVLVSAYWAFCFLWIRHRYSDTVLYYCLMGATASLGLLMGIASSPLDAIFADSIESGTRSRLFAYRSSLRTAGGAVGPAVSLVVFLTMGDVWQERELIVTIIAGVGCLLFPCSLLLLFRDRQTLGAESEGLHVTAASAATAPLPSGADAADAADAAGAGSATTAAPSALTEAQQQAARFASRRVCGCLTPSGIAPLVALSDFLVMLGSGMTIKFFALFFWRGLALGPAVVSAVYVAGPLGISVASLAAQRLSLVLGRLQVTLLCKVVGISLLVVIGRLDLHVPGAAAYVLPLYLVRTWLMNCCAGLTKSVLNDYVIKKNRAKWNALESLNTFSWSGSALLGGLLIDRFGYQVTFLITAALQASSAACLLPLLLLVQAEKGARGFGGRSNGGDGSRGSGGLGGDVHVTVTPTTASRVVAAAGGTRQGQGHRHGLREGLLADVQHSTNRG
jgi:hypothetical protein